MKRAILLALMLATAFAGLFSVEHTGTLFLDEDNEHILLVNNAASSSPVYYATVTIFSNDEKLDEAKTNLNGYATFTVHPETEGVVAFSVTHEDYNEYVLFQEIIERKIEEAAIIEPIPEPQPQDDATPITGFVSLNSGERNIFLFIMLLAFICLSASSYLFYQHFIQSEVATEEGAWESTELLEEKSSFDGLENAIKKLNS